MSQTCGVYEDAGLTADRFERLAARVETSGEQSPIPVRSPITEEQIGTIPACTDDDVTAAVERAREAQSSWAIASVESRAAVLERFGDIFFEYRGVLLAIAQLDTGQVR
jgi:succinate-semialdehyde dehydrogenase/glutarate-semialdehyde dehydrogenase